MFVEQRKEYRGGHLILTEEVEPVGFNHYPVIGRPADALIRRWDGAEAAEFVRNMKELPPGAKIEVRELIFNPEPVAVVEPNRVENVTTLTSTDSKTAGPPARKDIPYRNFRELSLDEQRELFFGRPDQVLIGKNHHAFRPRNMLLSDDDFAITPLRDMVLPPGGTKK